LHKHLLACALACGLWPAFAAGLEAGRPLDGLIHRRWDVADGLPNPAVRALAETPDGLLWVGTRTGLARFDGRSFELLAHESINHLLVDRDGVLWAGTEGGGILRYQDGRIRSFGTDDGLASATVTAMALDPQGRLLVATSGGGVALREGGLFSFVLRSAELSGPVVALAARGERVYLATAAELFVLEAGRLTAVAGGLPHPRALACGPAGELYLATDQGLRLLNGAGAADPFGGRSPQGALALETEADGTLWLGTLRGLWRTRPRNGELEPFLPGAPAGKAVVSALLLDRRGNLWLGSLDDGLHQLRENPLDTWGRREGLASEVLTSVAEDLDGKVWMAARRDGLARLDPATGRIESFTTGLPETDLWSVAVGPDGGLWLGSNTRGLLQRTGAGTWRSYGPEAGLPEGPVQAVRVTRDGSVWMATDNGLGRLAGGRLQVFTKADGLPSNLVRDIFEEPDGQLWIATMGGLARHLGGDRFETFAGGPTTPNGVLSIWQDDRGALWLATAGALVEVEAGRARALTIRDGLYSDDLSCAVGDRFGHLWIGTAKGLVRIRLDELRRRLDGDPAPLRQWIFDRRGGLRAGISNNGTAALASRSGRIYFASRGGLVGVDGERLEPLAAPPARLDQVVETPLEGWRSLTPATSGSRLLFRFSAPSLAAPDQLPLRYRLEGFDSDWRAAGNGNFAEYSRVPPGSYRFLLEAADQEGRFAHSPAAAPAAARIVIDQRWSLLFPALVLALAVALLALLHQVRMRWLKRRKTALQLQVEEALAELKVLRGMLPICSSCKRIRDDQGYWEEMESFFNSRSALEFERGACPECEERLATQRQSSGRVVRVVRAVPGGSS
jgi:ligand-binding sensor domain-containing protein